MTDRSVRVRISAITADLDRALDRSGAKARAFANDLDSADSRMSNLVQTALALGPALVPIGATAVPLIAGLAAQLGVATAAAGVSILAFQGVGDALDALNKAQLEPTAANIEKARQAFDDIGPAAQDFVVFLDDITPKVEQLQETAAAGLLPGVEDGLTEMLELLPEAKSLVGELADSTGDLFAEAGDNLNDDRWRDFFAFLEAEARPTLTTFARTAGNAVEGVANLMMALDPLADWSSAGLLEGARDFREWAAALDETEGYEAFVDYIVTNGPQVVDTLGSIGNAVVQLVEAAAPLGGPTLMAIELLANTLSAIANSPVGPVLIGAAAGMSAVSRAIALYNAANGSAMLGMLGGLGGKGKAAGIGARAAAAGLGVLALEFTNLDDKAGLANTASFALLGTIAGPWGAAIGAGVGLAKDFADANDDLADAIKDANAAASDPLGFTSQKDAIAGIKSEVADLESRYDGAVGTFGRAINPLNDLPAKLKIVYGGAADELSNAEDKAYKLQQQLHANQIAVADFYHELSTGKPSESTTDIYDDLKRIDEIAGELGPVLEELNIDPAVITDPSREGWDEAMQAIRAYMREQDSIPGRTGKVRSAFAELDSALASTEDKATALEAALESLLGPELNQAEAADAWQEGLNNLNEELAEHSNRLTGSSNAAIQNRGVIRDRVKALQDTIVADAKAGVGAERLATKLQSQRRALINTADAAGLNRKQVERLLNQYNLTPELVQTIFKTLGISKAEQEARLLRDDYNALPKGVRTELQALGGDVSRADVKRLQKQYGLTPAQVQTIMRAIDQAGGVIDFVRAQLRDLDGTVATTVIRTERLEITRRITTGGHVGPGIQQAAGGIVDFYAGGGMRTGPGDVANRHRPQIAPAGTYRVFGEDETGGEGYIPLADDWRRPRAKDIWREVGNRLGVQFREFATGGIFDQQPFATGGISSAGGGFDGVTTNPAVIRAQAAAIRALADAEERLARAERRHRRFEATRDDVQGVRERVRQLRAEKATRGDILRQQQQLRDIRRSLHGPDRARGLDRRVAQTELREARRELRSMRRSDNRLEAAIRRRERLERVLRRRYESVAREQARLEQAQRAAESAQELAGAGDIFGGPFASTMSAQRQVDNAIRDISIYGRIVSQLKARGASPFILEQIAAQARSGNFTGANRLGQALLDDPEALKRLNVSTQLLQGVASQVGGLQADPRFFAANSWRPPQFDRRGTAGAAAGNYFNVERLEVKAFSDDFSLKQVQDQLALHGVV